MMNLNGALPAASKGAVASVSGCAENQDEPPVLRECDIGFDPFDLVIGIRHAIMREPGEKPWDIFGSPGVRNMLGKSHERLLLSFHQASLAGVFDPARLPGLLENRRSILLYARSGSCFESHVILSACAETQTAQIWRSDRPDHPVERLRIAELPALFQVEDDRNAVLLEPETPASSPAVSLVDGLAGLALQGHQGIPAPQVEFAQIASDWANIVQSLPQGWGRDLALVQRIEARDFDTGRWDSLVRNISGVKRLVDDCGLNLEFFKQQFAYRDYIAFVDQRKGRVGCRFVVGVAPESGRLLCQVHHAEGVDHENISAADLIGLLNTPESESWRMILGPHMRFERRSDAPYHEVQCGNLCGLHALNALLGGPFASRFEFDRFVLATERKLLSEGFNETRFFLNGPMPDLSRTDAAPGDPISLDRLGEFIRDRIQAARLRTHPVCGFRNFDAIKEQVRVYQSDGETNAIIMLNQGHYVAFRRMQDSWLFIDSNSTKRARMTPLAYVESLKGKVDCPDFGVICLILSDPHNPHNPH